MMYVLYAMQCFGGGGQGAGMDSYLFSSIHVFYMHLASVMEKMYGEKLLPVQAPKALLAVSGEKTPHLIYSFLRSFTGVVRKLS